MTIREAAVIQAFTGVTMLAGDKWGYFLEYINDIMGRPVYTHEIPELRDDIKAAAKEDFISICRKIKE